MQCNHSLTFPEKYKVLFLGAFEPAVPIPALQYSTFSACEIGFCIVYQRVVPVPPALTAAIFSSQ